MMDDPGYSPYTHTLADARFIFDLVISFPSQTIVISDEDIRKQEERVVAARLKLQEALRSP